MCVMLSVYKYYSAVAENNHWAGKQDPAVLALPWL